MDITVSEDSQSTYSEKYKKPPKWKFTMRRYILLTVIVIIAGIQLGKASFVEDDEHAAALLNVDAGGKHGFRRG